MRLNHSREMRSNVGHVAIAPYVASWYPHARRGILSVKHRIKIENAATKVVPDAWSDRIAAEEKRKRTFEGLRAAAARFKAAQTT